MAKLSPLAVARLVGSDKSTVCKNARRGKYGQVERDPSNGSILIDLAAVQRRTGVAYSPEKIAQATATKKRGPRTSGRKLYSQADLEFAIAEAIEKDRQQRSHV